MRGWVLVFTGLALSLLLAVGGARAHFSAMPYYPGATPKTLCYSIDDDLGPLWQAWIENAVANWNHADSGWSFKPCETDEEKANPDIRFNKNYEPDKLPGGAKGRSRGGGRLQGRLIGYWEILIEPDVSGMTINKIAIKGGVDAKGWRMKDEVGETTLDPVMVLGHELGHALGLDHYITDPADTGNLEEAIAPGNHNKPVGRKPSANDVAQVKKGIANQQKAEEDARKAGHASAPRARERFGDPAGALVAEINAARTDPSAYAKSFGNVAGGAEAVSFLTHQSPVAPLTAEPLLANAAARHVADQGPGGLTGHTGTDGSTARDRIQGAGIFASIIAEDISLGQTTPGAVVRQWIIDEGNPTRMHRSDLFNPLFKFAGVACGPHKSFREMCVLDLTGPILARAPRGVSPALAPSSVR